MINFWPIFRVWKSFVERGLPLYAFESQKQSELYPPLFARLTCPGMDHAYADFETDEI